MSDAISIGSEGVSGAGGGVSIGAGGRSAAGSGAGVSFFGPFKTNFFFCSIPL